MCAKFALPHASKPAATCIHARSSAMLPREPPFSKSKASLRRRSPPVQRFMSQPRPLWPTSATPPDTEPLTLITFYLLDGDQDLITMLDPNRI